MPSVTSPSIPRAAPNLLTLCQMLVSETTLPRRSHPVPARPPHGAEQRLVGLPPGVVRNARPRENKASGNSPLGGALSARFSAKLGHNL